ncbi:MAG: hypothetical protein IJS39_15495, partial [Synergistaceae bacterium]|nr:hypothetical protein [Synergistaceae bacterium]
SFMIPISTSWEIPQIFTLAICYASVGKNKSRAGKILQTLPKLYQVISAKYSYPRGPETVKAAH